MIVIHAAGNARIGIGHLMRCKYLGEHLAERLDVPVHYVCETDLEQPERFAIRGADCRFVASGRTDALEAVRTVVSGGRAPRILIADLLNLTGEDRRIYRAMGFDILIQLNDNQTDRFRPDAVINGDAFGREWSVDPGETTVLSGPQYQIFSPAMRARRPREPWNRDAVGTVLVAFGGADPAHYTELVLENIGSLRELEDVRFHVVLGPAVSDERVRAMLSLARRNVVFLRQPDMAEAMAQADAVLSLGGITAYEAMLLGKPVGAFVWRHMAYYVEQLGRMGLVAALGEGHEAIGKLGSFLSDAETLRRIARRGWETVDGRGVERIASFIRSGYLESGAGS